LDKCGFERAEFMNRYHKRSNLESMFFMIKTKFGSNVKSRNRIRQYDEILCKVLYCNICVLIQGMHEMKV